MVELLGLTCALPVDGSSLRPVRLQGMELVGELVSMQL